MKTAARYKQYADECRELAKKMTGDNKEVLLRIAEAWDKVAEERASDTDE